MIPSWRMERRECVLPSFVCSMEGGDAGVPPPIPSVMVCGISEVPNKVLLIKPILSKYSSYSRPNQLDETAITYLQIDHTGLNHSHYISNFKLLDCYFCFSSSVIINHILQSCLNTFQFRSHFKLLNNLPVPLGNSISFLTSLLQFLKSTNLFDSI